MLGPRMILFCIFWVPTILTTLALASFSFFVRIDLDWLFGFAPYGRFACSGSRLSSSSSSTSSSSLKDSVSSSNLHSSLISNMTSTSTSCFCPITGRYSLVRTHLGLEGRPIALTPMRPHRKERIFAFDILAFPFLSLAASRDEDETSLSFQRKSARTRWKRSLDFVLNEQQLSTSALASSSSGSSNLIESSGPNGIWEGESTILKLTEDSSWDYSLNKQQVLDSFLSAAHRDEEEVALATLAQLKKEAKARERERQRELQRERQREREQQRERDRKRKERRKAHT